MSNTATERLRISLACKALMRLYKSDKPLRRTEIFSDALAGTTHKGPEWQCRFLDQIVTVGIARRIEQNRSRILYEIYAEKMGLCRSYADDQKRMSSLLWPPKTNEIEDLDEVVVATSEAAPEKEKSTGEEVVDQPHPLESRIDAICDIAIAASIGRVVAPPTYHPDLETAVRASVEETRSALKQLIRPEQAPLAELVVTLSRLVSAVLENVVYTREQVDAISKVVDSDTREANLLRNEVRQLCETLEADDDDSSGQTIGQKITKLYAAWCS